MLSRGHAPALNTKKNQDVHGPRRIVKYIYKNPTYTAVALFLLILSGPPRLRIRDAEASLRGDIDWVVILHVTVWTLAGLWVVVQIGKSLYAERPLVRLRLPLILGLALIACLSISIWKSAAPALTAFKVYQMLVCLLFTQIFVELFGIRTSLNAMLWGNALLCVAIAICAFLAPDLVWTGSDFNPDPSRLYGELIAPAGVVSVLAIILLLTVIRKLWKPLPMSLLALLFGILVLSLMRTAYITAFIFFVCAFLKRPNIKPLRNFTWVLFASLLTLYVCGLLPSLANYRSPETIPTLDGRIGLWRFLVAVTLHRSPWFGLGYYSASRIYVPEYNPWLGTAHSIFLEVFSGGGVASVVFLFALTLVLSTHAARLLVLKSDRLSFAAPSLFIACLIFGCMGYEIDSGPVAIGFWGAAAILPKLWSPLLKRATRNAEPAQYLPAMATREAEGT